MNIINNRKTKIPNSIIPGSIIHAKMGPTNECEFMLIVTTLQHEHHKPKHEARLLRLDNMHYSAGVEVPYWGEVSIKAIKNIFADNWPDPWEIVRVTSTFNVTLIIGEG